ncbi:B28.2 [miniopterid betaherpesvirus 1]|uniref:B28.2 n=1 Tax=miniopterid betaherpesvirus 1 TaxID=3070189 RepID=I3VPZ8_9BETA|nr:B28.2 [miniopterid betaherpesvirus 1]AFK83842.1 B28.2 [miniopterid betaherpesvirus 1]
MSALIKKLIQAKREAAVEADVLADFEYRELCRHWNGGVLVRSIRDAWTKFVRHFKGVRVKVAWPPEMCYIVGDAEKSGFKGYLSDFKSFSSVCDLDWIEFIGVLCKMDDHEGVLPDTTLQVIVGCDKRVYGLDAEDRVLYVLCDNAATFLDTGARGVRKLYRVDFGYDDEAECILFGHYVRGSSSLYELLTKNYTLAHLIRFAREHPGRVFRGLHGNHIFITGDEDFLGLDSLIPEGIIEGLKSSGYMIIGMSSFVDVNVVLANVSREGVFHLLTEGKVVRVAEDLRTYVRIRDPILLDGSRRVFYGNVDKNVVRVGRVFCFFAPCFYKLPDRNFFSVRWGHRGMWF